MEFVTEFFIENYHRKTIESRASGARGFFDRQIASRVSSIAIPVLLALDITYRTALLALKFSANLLSLGQISKKISSFDQETMLKDFKTLIFSTLLLPPSLPIALISPSFFYKYVGYLSDLSWFSHRDYDYDYDYESDSSAHGGLNQEELDELNRRIHGDNYDWVMQHSRVDSSTRNVRYGDDVGSATGLNRGELDGSNSLIELTPYNSNRSTATASLFSNTRSDHTSISVNRNSSPSGNPEIRIEFTRGEMDTKEGVISQLKIFTDEISRASGGIKLKVFFNSRIGEREHGMDAGGLSREYLRLLIEGIIKHKILPSIEINGVKYLDLKQLESPSIEKLRYLERLGKIMMICYLSKNNLQGIWNNKLISGDFFKVSLIKDLNFLSERELDCNLSDLSSSRRKEIFYALMPGEKDYIDLIFKDPRSLSDEEWELLQEGFENLYHEFPEGADRTNRNHFIKIAYKEFEEEFIRGRFYSLQALARGMRAQYPSGSSWETWRQTAPEQISTSIQGKFNRCEFAQMIRANKTGNNDFSDKVEFLARWILSEDTKEKKIRKFLIFVTGATAISPNSSFKITPIERGTPSALPITHTCGNKIDLWHRKIPAVGQGYGDSTYEAFVRSIERSIVEVTEIGNH